MTVVREFLWLRGAAKRLGGIELLLLEWKISCSE
jgi:hypothetical protein